MKPTIPSTLLLLLGLSFAITIDFPKELAAQKTAANPDLVSITPREIFSEITPSGTWHYYLTEKKTEKPRLPTLVSTAKLSFKDRKYIRGLITAYDKDIIETYLDCNPTPDRCQTDDETNETACTTQPETCKTKTKVLKKPYLLFTENENGSKLILAIKTENFQSGSFNPDINCGGTILTPGVYTLNTSCQINGTTAITISAQNVTLDCQGFSITGNNATNTYGIFSTQFNTTVRNCNISNFSEAIRFSGATNGLIQNNTLSSTFNGGFGIRLSSSAHQNSIMQNTITNGNATGIHVEGGSNISIDCQGRNIIGGNFSGTYGIFSSQFNTTVRNCNISDFANGLYTATGSSLTTLENNTINITSSSNAYSILGCPLTNSTIINNTFTVASAAVANIGLTCGVTNNNNIIANNTIMGTGNSGGVYLNFGTNNTVANNRIIANAGTSSGINLIGGSHRNTFTANNISMLQASSHGISITDGQNNTIDCQGFSITGNNATNTYGISSTQFNTTIRNCNISNFQTAIITTGSDGLYENITARTTFTNWPTILFNPGSMRNTLTNSIVINTGANVNGNCPAVWVRGINDTVRNTTAHSNNCAGIGGWAGVNSTLVINSTGSSHQSNGIYFADTSGVRIIDSTAHSNTSIAIRLINSHTNLILNSTGNSTSSHSISVEGGQHTMIDCMGKNLTGNNVAGTQGIFSTQFNTTIRNCIISNFNIGIAFSAASNGTIENNTLSNSADFDTLINLASSSNNNLFINNNATGTRRGLFIQSGTGNQIIGGSYTGSYSGIDIQTESNTIANLTATSTRNGTTAGLAGININAQRNTITNATARAPLASHGIYIIGTNNTVDCQGASVTGANITGTYGIAVFSANATIRNCNVSQFQSGIYNNGGLNMTVLNNTVSHSNIGVDISNARFANISGNRLHVRGTSGSGIWFGGSGANMGNITIEENEITTGNASNHGGIYLTNITNTTIARNNFTTINTPAIHQFNFPGATNINIIGNRITTINATGINIGLPGGNFTIDCQGMPIIGDNSSNTHGIFSNAHADDIITNCNISNYQFGITIQNTSNTSVCCTNISVSRASGAGLQMIRGVGNRISNLNINSLGAGSPAILRQHNIGAVMNRITASSAQSDALNATNGTGITLANSTLATQAGCGKRMASVRNAMIINTTFISASGNHICLDANSSNNTFALNNFTNTLGLYVLDSNGSNFYSAVVNGFMQGNIYGNVVNGSVVITGSSFSSVEGFYIGSGGPGYPYSASSSQGKFNCSGGCTDAYALTPVYAIPWTPIENIIAVNTGLYPFWDGGYVKFMIPYYESYMNATTRNIVAYGKLSKIGLFNYGTTNAWAAFYDESGNLIHNMTAPAGYYVMRRGVSYEVYGNLRIAYGGNNSIVVFDVKVFGD